MPHGGYSKRRQTRIWGSRYLLGSTPVKKQDWLRGNQHCEKRTNHQHSAWIEICIWQLSPMRPNWPFYSQIGHTLGKIWLWARRVSTMLEDPELTDGGLEASTPGLSRTMEYIFPWRGNKQIVCIKKSKDICNL